MKKSTWDTNILVSISKEDPICVAKYQEYIGF
jgi:hypothetical protein